MKKRVKLPTIRFSDGLASGQYQIVTDKSEVDKLIAIQRGGKGTGTHSSLDTAYSVIK